MLMKLVVMVALLVGVVGTAYRIFEYHRTPNPVRIVRTPAPLNRRGVAFRLLRETLLFESLFKASMWTWIFSWTFHVGLVLIFLTHLWLVFDALWFPLVWLLPFKTWFSVITLFGLCGLLLRRCMIARIRFISAPSDFLMLGLLIGMVLSGLLLRFYFYADIPGLRQFIDDLITFNATAFPRGVVLLLHVLGACCLIFVFPFSKLLHAPGVFFSPTLNQVDNARETRHVNPRGDQQTTAGGSDPTAGEHRHD